MVPLEIPARTSSRYNGQYAGSVDPQRLKQIFTESMTLALHSQNAETATSRFDLAIEAYHQLLTLPLSSGDRQELQAAMAGLTADLPLRMCMNEARGLCAKATKLKTPRRKLELLRQAKAALERGVAMGLGGSHGFEDLQKQVATEIASVEAQESTG